VTGNATSYGDWNRTSRQPTIKTRTHSDWGSRYGHMSCGSRRWPIICRVAAIETWELKPGDWRVWRKLRQSALAEAPEAFGSALADWTGARDTEQRWLVRLRDVPVNLVIALDGEPAEGRGRKGHRRPVISRPTAWSASPRPMPTARSS
jgi:hypothetical protein